MSTFQLRTVAVRDEGCFSAICYQGRPFAVSLERTFADGRPVIGNGVYRCERTFFNRGGYATFEIMVPGHSRVLFHRGNVETDSEACILVAESFAMFNNIAGIADSKHGFEEFMALAGGLDEFDLEVSGR